MSITCFERGSQGPSWPQSAVQETPAMNTAKCLMGGLVAYLALAMLLGMLVGRFLRGGGED